MRDYVGVTHSPILQPHLYFRCSHPLGDLIFCHGFKKNPDAGSSLVYIWEVIGGFRAKKMMGFNTILKDQLRISALNSKLIQFHS